MKYYLVAGEKSGDLHAANLMRALKEADPEAVFRCWGGDDMAQAGGEVVRHYREYAVMGVGEILKKLPLLRRFIGECARDMADWRPDVAIFIDFAGFNLRVAAKAKAAGLRTFYYISPKVWAWNQKRALKIKRTIDRMFVIMSFEPAFYRKFGYEVDYVGNPIFDAIEAFRPDPDFAQRAGLDGRPVLALLPGSRRQEVEAILPPMVGAARQFPDHQVVVAGVDHLPEALYRSAQEAGFPIILNDTYNLLAQASFALVTSGTATLETALFGVPQVVAYKTSWLTYWFGRMVLQIPYISLVNLVAERLLAEEIIQQACTPQGLAEALRRAMANEPALREACRLLYQTVRTEGASKRAAQLMVGYLKAPASPRNG